MNDFYTSYSKFSEVYLFYSKKYSKMLKIYNEHQKVVKLVVYEGQFYSVTPFPQLVQVFFDIWATFLGRNFQCDFFERLLYGDQESRWLQGLHRPLSIFSWSKPL